jgi:hypothetical protein
VPLKNNFTELGEWTVRLLMAGTQQPNLPIYSVNKIYLFQSPVLSKYQAFPTRQPLSFFEDEFTLPLAFLTNDRWQQAGGADNPTRPTALRLSPTDPFFHGDDTFGLCSDEW